MDKLFGLNSRSDTQFAVMRCARCSREPTTRDWGADRPCCTRFAMDCCHVCHDPASAVSFWRAIMFHAVHAVEDFLL